MKTYIGTKLIQAQPMTRAAYNEYRGWVLPANENGEDTGYLVEYIDGGKANDSRHAGYISWSPSDVFAKAYRECGGMPFGHAIEALKAGLQVARAGWNGKGMYLFIQHGSIRQNSGDIGDLIGGVDRGLFQIGDTDTLTRMPCICMRAADGSIVTGWLASQTDVLSTDWAVIA